MDRINNSDKLLAKVKRRNTRDAEKIYSKISPRPLIYIYSPRHTAFPETSFAACIFMRYIVVDVDDNGNYSYNGRGDFSSYDAFSDKFVRNATSKLASLVETPTAVLGLAIPCLLYYNGEKVEVKEISEFNNDSAIAELVYCNSDTEGIRKLKDWVNTDVDKETVLNNIETEIRRMFKVKKRSASDRSQIKESFVGTPEIGKTYWFKHSGGIRCGEYVRSTTSLHCFYVPEVDREVCIPIWANIATTKEDIENIERVVDKMEKDTKVPTKMRAYNGGFYPVNESKLTEDTVEKLYHSYKDIGKIVRFKGRRGNRWKIVDFIERYYNSYSEFKYRLKDIDMPGGDAVCDCDAVELVPTPKEQPKREQPKVEEPKKDYSYLIRKYLTPYALVDIRNVVDVSNPGKWHSDGAIVEFTYNGKTYYLDVQGGLTSERDKVWIREFRCKDTGEYYQDVSNYADNRGYKYGTLDLVKLITTGNWGSSNPRTTNGSRSSHLADSLDRSKLTEGIWAYQTYIDYDRGAKQPNKTLVYGNHFIVSRSPYKRDEYGPEWKNHISKIIEWSQTNNPGMIRVTHDYRLNNFGKECDSEKAFIAAIEDEIKRGHSVLITESTATDLVEKKKRKKGIHINKDAGNVEHNINMFNMANNPVGAPCNNPVSGPMGGNVGCCESLNESSNIPERAKLISALKTFDRNGKVSERGSWKVANGGYDLAFEVYYKGQPVAQGMSDGKIKTDFDTSEFGFTKEDLKKAICSVFSDMCESNNLTEDKTTDDIIDDLINKREYIRYRNDTGSKYEFNKGKIAGIDTSIQVVKNHVAKNSLSESIEPMTQEEYENFLKKSAVECYRGFDILHSTWHIKHNGKEDVWDSYAFIFQGKFFPDEVYGGLNSIEKTRARIDQIIKENPRRFGALEYDRDAATKFEKEFDVMSPQEVADNFGREVKDGDTTYSPNKKYEGLDDDFDMFMRGV